MHSLRSIFLAAAVFATVASAIPTASPASNNVGVDIVVNLNILDPLGNVADILTLYRLEARLSISR
jgi:hypothetical protein